jgi:CubicO group peptidase (beta-lactamase class C family)
MAYEERTLAENIARRSEETGFSGAVGIYRGGTPVLEFASGLADRSNAIPNTPATRFGIASATKGITALAILRLIYAGLTSFTATVHEILHDRPGWIDSRATLEDLLAHRSGVYDYYDEEIIEDFDNFTVSIPWFQLEKPADYLPLFAGQKPKFTPGERFSYSNGGYVLLAYIAELVSGRPFPDLVRDEVLAGASASRSGFFRFDSLPEGCASGYIDDGVGGWRTNIYQLPVIGSGDGGMFATVSDIDAVWRGFFEDRIVGRSVRDRALRTVSRVNAAFDYGLGFYLDRRFSRDGEQIRACALVGSDAGVGFESVFLPESGLSATMVSNTTDGHFAVHSLILDWLKGIENR